MVTVGIPCHNEKDFIEETIESVLAAEDVERVLISDNASDDGTSEICQRYANSYSKITYTRHDSNIGMMPNFKYVSDHIETPYICFVGGHDLIPSNYIVQLKKLLDTYPEAVLAFGSAQWLDRQNNVTGCYSYDYKDSLLDENTIRRVYNFLVNIQDCTLYNGLWRTKVLQECACYEAYIGPDVIAMARALTYGTFVCSQDTYYGRRMVREETWEDHLERYQKVLNTKQSMILGHWADVALDLLKHMPGICPVKRAYYIHQFKKHLGRTFVDKTKSFVKKYLLRSGQRDVITPDKKD